MDDPGFPLNPDAAQIELDQIAKIINNPQDAYIRVGYLKGYLDTVKVFMSLTTETQEQ